ncbi:putative mitochondrial adenine nucleotide transporter BTL2 [Hibiscus syriacus]|uniref:Mitochondrial adenine nucleotide transporter BTL2 n=1 Tax=Hibiscus syriacus TaxID=106335 RepID=A0A6A3AQK8_HIBSY|nr:putative mitochondrial adenine nucleotide transporter BTL2 [Hibiscus syriacus]
MHSADRCLFIESIRASKQLNLDRPFLQGGLFLNDKTVSSSFVSPISLKTQKCFDDKNDNVFLVSYFLGGRKTCQTLGPVKSSIGSRSKGGWFLSVSLSAEEGHVGESGEDWGENGDKNLEAVEIVEEEKEKEKKGSGALNTTKHLWAGAVAAMVSRTFIAPLERLKLEYIVRGEKKNLFELIKWIAATQGLKGFWKGNFLNILRTAPFKAINFYAYDIYRSQLLKLSGNEEATNSERFLAGAAAGITATLLCLPMDTLCDNFELHYLITY